MNKAKQNTKENLSEKLHFLIGRLNRKKTHFPSSLQHKKHENTWLVIVVHFIVFKLFTDNGDAWFFFFRMLHCKNMWDEKKN